MQAPYPHYSTLPDEFYMDFIAVKKAIEYEYAEPYLMPLARPDLETEPELRDRVRTAVLDLSPEERCCLNTELSRAWNNLLRQHGVL